jgi:AraC-like DNA-binding protein
MDPLSNALRAISIDRTTYCCSDLGAPWGITFGARPHATLHVVHRGLCWLQCGAAPAIELRSGDVVLLATGAEHGFVDRPGRPTRLVDFHTHPMADRAGPPPRWGGDGARTLLVCIELQVGDGAGLVGRLPPVIHLRSGEIDHGLPLTLDALANETLTARPASEIVTRRLIDVLLVQTLRGWLQRDGPEVRSWLAGVADPAIATALALMNERPDDPWTVDRLARRVGKSRARFCERFVEVVGETPVAYLTKVRMQRAAVLLRTRSDLAVGQIAERAGYDSEAAFNRAFKRLIGVPPGRYRRGLEAAWDLPTSLPDPANGLPTSERPASVA